MKQQLGIWGRFLRGNVAVLILGAILTGSLFALSPVVHAADIPDGESCSDTDKSKHPRSGCVNAASGGNMSVADRYKLWHAASAVRAMILMSPKYKEDICSDNGDDLDLQERAAYYSSPNDTPKDLGGSWCKEDDKVRSQINEWLLESASYSTFVQMTGVTLDNKVKDRTKTDSVLIIKQADGKWLRKKKDESDPTANDLLHHVRMAVKAKLGQNIEINNPSDAPADVKYYGLSKAIGASCTKAGIREIKKTSNNQGGDTIYLANDDTKPTKVEQYKVEVNNDDDDRYVLINAEFTNDRGQPNVDNGTNSIGDEKDTGDLTLGDSNVLTNMMEPGFKAEDSGDEAYGSASCKEIVKNYLTKDQYAKAYLERGGDQAKSAVIEQRDISRNAVWKEYVTRECPDAADAYIKSGDACGDKAFDVFTKARNKCWGEARALKVDGKDTDDDSKEAADHFIECLNKELDTSAKLDTGAIDNSTNKTYEQPPATDNDNDADTEGKPTCELGYGIGWLICPITHFLAGITDSAYGIVSWMLDYNMMRDPSARDQMYESWTQFRNLANIAFVIVFLIVIFSQVSNVALDNYAIKRMMPRLIVGAILVNVSFWVCGLAIDISNVLGNTLKDALSDAAPTITFGGVFDQILAGTLVVAGLAAAAAIGAMAIGMPVLLGALVAIATTFLILVLRQALITILVIISPIAFVANLLPNTESWFKKWQKMFTGLLLVFPAIAILFGGSQFASKVFLGLDNDDAAGGLWILLGLGIMMIPLFLTLKVIQAISQMGSMGDVIGKMTGKGINGAQSKYKDSAFGQSRAREKRNRDMEIKSGNYEGKKWNVIRKTRNAANKRLNNVGRNDDGTTKDTGLGRYAAQRDRVRKKDENEYMRDKAQEASASGEYRDADVIATAMHDMADVTLSDEKRHEAYTKFRYLRMAASSNGTRALEQFDADAGATYDANPTAFHGMESASVVGGANPANVARVNERTEYAERIIIQNNPSGPVRGNAGDDRSSSARAARQQANANRTPPGPPPGGSPPTPPPNNGTGQTP